MCKTKCKSAQIVQALIFIMYEDEDFKYTIRVNK